MITSRQRWLWGVGLVGWLAAAPLAAQATDVGSWSVRVEEGAAEADAEPGTEPTWRSVDLLADWEEQGLLGVDGTVWLRGHLTLSPRQRSLALDDDLGLAFGPCRFGAYELFAGGVSLGRSPGWEHRLPVPRGALFRIPPETIGEDGSLRLRLRLRREGAASDTIAGGSAFGDFFALDSLQLLRSRLALARARALLQDVPLLILGALFTVVALYHLFLFGARPSERAYLWFGLFSFGFALNTLCNSSFSRLLTDRLDIIVRLGDASGHLAAALGLQFLWTFFARPIAPWLRAYQVSHLVWAVFLLLAPTPWIFVTSSVRWLWLLPLLALALLLLFTEVRRGSRHAGLLALGGGFLVICELAEVIFELRGHPLAELPWAPLGFAGVLASMGMALSARFRRVFAEREQLRLGLEEKVRERTAALSEATEKARQASRMKSQFLANISHEIRTPLNGVIGMTSLLAGTSLTEQQYEYVQTIRGSGELLLGLINDLLDLSKIETGKLDIRRAPFDLVEVIEECVGLVTPMAADKGLELVCEIAPGAPQEMEGDSARTRQIMVNLLSNAIKFTEAGQVSVLLEAWPRPGEEIAGAHITVRDTGIGISESELESLFVPFHQLDGSMTRKHGGSGLGLAITKHLVDLLGGEIRVESSPGQGSAFHLVLHGPVLSKLAAQQASKLTRSRFDEGFAQRHPLRLLLAEDHAVNQKVTRLMLSRLGYDCDLAVDGKEALDALAREPYDVVLMDIQMPEMDGLEATRTLRRQPPAGRRPYVIALTAHAMEGDRERCLEAGMDDYLDKPLRLEPLETALRRAHGVLCASRTGGVVDQDETGGNGEQPEESSAPPLPDAVLDPERVEVLRELESGGSEPLIAPLVASYLERSEHELDDLAEAVLTRDREAVEQQAHRLAGASSNLGLARVAALARQLEDSAREATFAELRQRHHHLAGEISRARSALVGELLADPEEG